MNTKKYPFPVQVPQFSTPKDLKQLSWQSLLFYHQLRFLTDLRKTNGLWINLSSRRLRERFGKHYASHIEALSKNNWIEINPRYRNAEGGFTKSFRLSDITFCCRHKDHIAMLGKTSWLRLTRKHFADESDISCDYLKLIKSRHDLLSIPKAPRSRVGKILKAKLDCKIANLSRGENQRLYSTIIMAKKETRTLVLLGRKGRLVNVDVSAMAQQILNSGINDPQWNQWIKKDFFTCLSKSLDLPYSRKKLKELFMKAISKSKSHTEALSISSFLRKEFPQIMKKVDQFNCFSTVQMETQKREASLIENFIMSHQHLTMIPAHDGVFCGELEALTVQEALENFLKSRGLIGITKISPEIPQPRQRSLFEILESIPENPSIELKAS
jgi:hypothetical protein